MAPGAPEPSWASGPSERQRNYASNLNEYDSLISSYEHLTGMPDAAEALTRLRKIASFVKPIMRKRGWHVSTFTEFLPEDPRLLGLNVNHGQKICIRLRYTHRPSSFLPIEQCIDTMLHELSHIVFGPHDDKFHALWEELRDEHETLLLKGYTGEGFLSKGRKLGGGRMPPPQELRRLARQNAEETRKSSHGSQKKSLGFRLGGRRILPGQDPRRVIADAIERRNTIDRGCASGSAEADSLAKQNTRRTIMTRADDDDANDRAIAEALLELMEAEEMQKLERNDSAQPPHQMTEEEEMRWAIEESMKIASAARANDDRRQRSTSPASGLGPRGQSPRSNSTPPYRERGPPPVHQPREQYHPYRPPPEDIAPVSRTGTGLSNLSIPNTIYTSDNRSPHDPNGALTDLAGALTAASAPTWKEGVDRIKRKPTNPLSRTSTGDFATLSTSSTPPPLGVSGTSTQGGRPAGPSRTVTPTDLINKPLPTPPALDEVDEAFTWQCETCTCINPVQYLACDACGIERSSHVTARLNRSLKEQHGGGGGGDASMSGGAAGTGSSSSRPAPDSAAANNPLLDRSAAANLERVGRQSALLARPESMGWSCRRCATFMEHRYWTCSVCGLMKGDSRANEHVLS